MHLARIRGRLKGRPPKLSAKQRAYVVKLFDSGDYTVAEIADLMNVGRSTVYRTAKRCRGIGATPANSVARGE
jgi:DNA invertase Pin-like site-specific DNA recombinase